MVGKGETQELQRLTVGWNFRRTILQQIVIQAITRDAGAHFEWRLETNRKLLWWHGRRQ